MKCSGRDYLRALQNSRYRESAYDEWADYRVNLTDFIISHCDQLGSITIYGAGRCCDIDIGRMVKHFSEVSLVDINQASMLEAMDYYGLRNNPKVSCYMRDFAGIPESSYVYLIEEMVRDIDRNGLPESVHICSVLDSIYETARKHILDFSRMRSDYVLVLSVHSQLNDLADWICTDLAQKSGCGLQQVETIRQRIAQETKVMVRKFNDALIRSTVRQLFTGYEIGISSIPKQVQGAVEASEDLTRRMKEGQIGRCAELRLDWPYNLQKGIIYNMLLTKWETYI